MHTKPSPVPYGQGIYVLWHRPTKSIYIGSSTNLRGRMIEWRCAMKNKQQRLAHFPSLEPNEWVFEVVQRTEGMSVPDLRKLETHSIEKAKIRGLTVLNKATPAVMCLHEVGGEHGSATFFATKYGKTPSGVTEKLNRGYTIKQALGLEPAPPPRISTFDTRQHAINSMPTKLIASDGKPVTYSEAATITNRSEDALRQWARRERQRSPGLAELHL